MKTIKVFSFGTHQTKDRHSGVDYARVYQPMKYLNGFEYNGYKFTVDQYDINDEKQKDWRKIAKNYDVVFLNYIVWDWAYVHMAMPVHEAGKKIILDLDDAIWNVRPDNISYKGLKMANAGYITTCVLDDVDGVTTTNGYLRNIIADKSYKKHNQIKVLPNYIDLTQYSQTFPARDTHMITLLHYGSTSHFDDLLIPEFVDGVDRIFKDYPNVQIKMVGAFIPQLKAKWGQRYINDFGDVDIYKWIKKFPKFMEEADIIVVPLEDDVYNRAKSDIKAKETATAMKPGIFSDVRPYHDYVEHGKTGFLASTADDWYKYLKILIDSKEKRQEIGQNAYNRVLQEQMKDHVAEYASFFLKILTW